MLCNYNYYYNWEEFFTGTHLRDNSGFLKEVLFDLGTFYTPSLIKVDINVLAESARVVIPDCFCISKCCIEKFSF